MQLDADLIAKIAAPIVSLVVGAIVKRYTEVRSRLVSYLGHVAAFPRGTDPKIHSHSVVLLNAGKKSAFNVRVPHGVSSAVVNVQVTPSVHFSVEKNPLGNFELLFPTLAPGEQVTIAYLYQEPIVWSQVSGHPKSDDGLAEIVRAIPAPPPNKLVLATVGALIFVGISFLVYVAVRWGLQSAT